MDLAVDPDKRIQPSGGGGMEPPGFGKRLMSVLRAVYHMLRRGLCRKRLMMDLHLLLGRGKLAGKALRNLVAAANHPHRRTAPTTTSWPLAPARELQTAPRGRRPPRPPPRTCRSRPTPATWSSAARPRRPTRTRGRCAPSSRSGSAGAAAEPPGVATGSTSPRWRARSR